MTSNIVLSNVEFKTVGKRPIRHDGLDKVTGKALYGADVLLGGLVHGKILRSPHAHARIVSIDTSKAEAHPAVLAVATSKDFPETSPVPRVLGAGPPVNVKFLSANILAQDKVLYKGHAVAAVAATNPHAAEEVLSLIDVEYEVLEPVFDVESAFAPDAPTLHEGLPGSKADGVGRPNVAGHTEYALGNVEGGFSKADVIVEREFRTKTVHQGYIEPHSATVAWQPDGRLTIWSSSQGHFAVRDRTAAVLDIPNGQIRAMPMEIGGGFGGKTTIYLEPVAAVLSKKSGRPVKITMSRPDVMEASGPTSGGYVKVKMGATSDGKLTAADATLMLEAGAYPGSPVGGAALCMFSPYDLENVRLHTYDVVDNKPKTTAYRAPGAPIGGFGVESVVDEISEKLNMDPLEFRLLNAAKEGDRRIDGVVHPKMGCVETTEAARDHAHYQTRLEGPYRGRGIASGYWMNGSNPASASAAVNFDGTVNLTEGAMDIGGSRPAAAQMFAEVLGIPVEDVNPQVGDTDTVGYTGTTGGSSVAFKIGWACYEAAQDVKEQMIGRAASLWETSTSEIELVDGVFQHKSDPELRMSFKELAEILPDTGGPIVGSASMTPAGAGPAIAVHIVDVEVDPETGKVTILRYTGVQDAGKAVHPSYVEGQIQGGIVQGIGWALNEEYFMSDDGQMLNTSLLDYRMPTSLDLPMIDTVIVEVANPGHPYGVRGVGEVPIVPPMAAIANAIYDATGVRMTDLPMNPPAVTEALAQHNGT